jgi:hypothetical protein
VKRDVIEQHGDLTENVMKSMDRVWQQSSGHVDETIDALGFRQHTIGLAEPA